MVEISVKAARAVFLYSEAGACDIFVICYFNIATLTVYWSLLAVLKDIAGPLIYFPYDLKTSLLLQTVSKNK